MTTRSLPYTRPGSPPTGSSTATVARAPNQDPPIGPPTGLPPGPPPGLPEIDSISARAATENFRVVSRLLPREIAGPLMDVYRYARFVDEIGDSYDGDRLAALDWVESEVHRSIAGDVRVHPIVAGAANLVRQGRVSPEPLLKLVEANRRDQIVSRYESYGELLAYCELSANPVGRLVLELFGSSTPERESWSDSMCTGLQLVEHWQDIGEDAKAGRVYLPAEDLRRFAVDPSELIGCGPASPVLRSAMAFECGRARELLDGGFPLITSLRGRLKIAVAGFWAGGHAALDALERHDFDPLSGPARPEARRVVRHMSRALAPRRHRPDLSDVAGGPHR